jgi:hypothetical protein
VSVIGPGGRSDTLDDFCNYHNWQKTTSLGESALYPLSHAVDFYPGNQLLRRLTLAIPQAIIHHRAFRAFNDGLRSTPEYSLILMEWETQVQDWEAGRANFCPYDLPEESEWSI